MSSLKKQVLIIDEPPLFREFLKNKLSAEDINVEFANGRRDAFTKILSLLPDVLIVDTPQDYNDLRELLEKKRSDPNAKSIPVILTGPVLSRERILELPYYNVVKYFNKPIKFDIFFESIGRLLKVPLSIDTTACIMDVHLNDNIIFIEIAQGLNREKLALLKYKISELIEDNELHTPKIILMLTDLELSFIDGANLELLLDNIIADEHVQKKNVKILSFDEFTKQLIKGHEQYNGIEITKNLSAVLTSLIKGDAGEITDVINDHILAATEDVSKGSIQMKFYSESGIPESLEKSPQDLIGEQRTSVALVDDDHITLKKLSSAFKHINADADLFVSGSEFLFAANKKIYDLVILDILMPGLSGFDILQRMSRLKYPAPIIIYTGGSVAKEDIHRALTLGAKSFLVKQADTDPIIKKAIELLHSRL